MFEFISLAEFHFLRPAWLLVIPLAIYLLIRMNNRYSSATQWQKTIAPHLLKHLINTNKKQPRLRPYQLFIAALILMSLSLSGPTFKPILTPYTQDRAPLVIALQLTDSMLAKDQPPTRLDRAKQKIRDIIKSRPGAHTSVIAYSGSAHTVLPLTDDVELIEIYLDSLEPAIMPQSGNNPSSALALVTDILSNEEIPGTILFMTDGVDSNHSESFEKFSQTNLNQIIFLAVGSDQGGRIDSDNMTEGLQLAPGIDMNSLNKIAKASKGTVVRSSVDDADINRIIRLAHSYLVNAASNDEKIQWHDAGYYLVWLIALVALFWFRRGWTIQWR